MNKEKLIDNLNSDLADELSAMIQYLTYSAKVTGPYRPQLAQFLMDEVPDEQGHAQFLSNKIVALGGEPTSEPSAVPSVQDNQAMLKAVLQAEREAIANYGQRVSEAMDFGDKGLAVQLEDMLADETRHAEETERILRDWAL
ncbi:MAG: ferritin-like domain-containing protein [Caldilineaceae bacterium]|nr:ferritin-like domain-containing protein [Caldilineaceae bacterium]